MLVTVEGLDGAGKHTVVVGMWRDLQVETYSFPDYSSPVGKKIQKLLRDPDPCNKPHPLIWASFFAQDRLEVKEDIQADLADNLLVVCDRYVETNVAYQGILRGDDHLTFAHEIFQLEYDINEMPKPDLILYLDLPVETAVQRIKSRLREPEAFDGEAKLRAVANAYEWMMKRDERWVRIDATQSPDKVLNSVLEVVRGWRSNPQPVADDLRVV